MLLLLLNGPIVEVDHLDLSSKEPKQLRHSKFQIKETCVGVGGGSVGGSVGDPRPTGGLELEVLDLDTEMQWDKPVSATLRLINRGDSAVSIPDEFDPQQFETPNAAGEFEYSEVAFGVIAQEGFSARAASLFGDAKKPGTMRILKPNEALRVKALFQLQCMRSEAECSESKKLKELRLTPYFGESLHKVKYHECSTSSSSEGRRWVNAKTVSVLVKH